MHDKKEKKNLCGSRQASHVCYARAASGEAAFLLAGSKPLEPESLSVKMDGAYTHNTHSHFTLMLSIYATVVLQVTILQHTETFLKVIHF